jgi:hypothetical protein
VGAKSIYILNVHDLKERSGATYWGGLGDHPPTGHMRPLSDAVWEFMVEDLRVLAVYPNIGMLKV